MKHSQEMCTDWLRAQSPREREAMNPLLIWIGRIAGLVGLVTVGCAVMLRAAGMWHLGGLQLGTLLNAGVAAMVLGTWAYAASIAEGKRPQRL